VAIEGPLKELSIHDVFQLLDLSRKTGTLRVVSELRQNAGTVYFEDGVVVGAEIRSNPHPLGRLLVRAGRLSEQDLARARALQSAGDPRRLGEILVAESRLSQRDLDRYVRQQIEEVVFELVGWSEGYFAFEDGKHAEWPTEAASRIATGVLLMEAARRTDEWSRIEKKITHLGLVPDLAPVVDTAAPLDLLPGEWEVLSAIDGQRSVRELAVALGRPDFEVARTLFGLATAGIIVLDDPSRRAVEAIGTAELPILLTEVDQLIGSGDPEAAVLAAQQAVVAHPQEPLAHLSHGRALLAATRFPESTEALWQAVQLDPQSAAAHRLYGLSLAAEGRFREAAQVWDQWRRLREKSPEEAAHQATVERVREAALALDLALRGARG
jgi:cytochrome c-type biogenesis protein CcmH/NrfG